MFDEWVGVTTIVSFIALSAPASAQTDRGTLTGTVKDSTGAVVQAATVKAVHVATNFERSVTTSPQGTPSTAWHWRPATR